MQKLPTIMQFDTLIDNLLNKTQRKTPTVIRRTMHISRIRNFYIKKVQFFQTKSTDYLNKIITEFPRLEALDGFYAEYINILYNKNKYKITLSNINNIKNLIDKNCSSYIRLLKHGDTLYRCKELKRACFGQAVSYLKKLKNDFDYLQKISEELNRLPSLRNNRRTILVSGVPNSGKSTLINKMTKCKSPVENVPFSTKSIFVGHFDYKQIDFQMVDLPGLLNRPINEMNQIEQQSISALAHIEGTVIFLFDLTGTYSMESQIELYLNLEKLLKNILIVKNKCDLTAESEIWNNFIAEREFFEISAKNNFNIEILRENICEQILNENIAKKISRVDEIKTQVNIEVPKTLNAKGENHMRPEKIEIDRSMPVNDKAFYLLDKNEWVNDVVPEIMNGKNLADMIIDEDIVRMTEELLEEEHRRVYKTEEEYDLLTEQEENMKEQIYDEIRNKQAAHHSLRREAMPKKMIEKARRSRGANIIPTTDKPKKMKKNLPRHDKSITRDRKVFLRSRLQAHHKGQRK